MNIDNIQSLISKGLIAQSSDIDPTKTFIQIGVFQPGNRQIGSGNANTYKSYTMALDQIMSAGGITSAQNGLTVVGGTTVELGGTLIQDTDVDINGYSQLFSNGNYPLLFLDPSKNWIGIGTNSPTAMLDIVAIGNGTKGLRLRTASTQDAILGMSTNTAATDRMKLYVDNTTQTTNLYTVGGDTIFWNGTSVTQSKTLTLFTNTTAMFESSVGIRVVPTATLHVKGVSATSADFAFKADDSAVSPLLYIRNDGNVGIGVASPSARLQVQQTAFSQEHFRLSGADFYGAGSSADGVSLLLGVSTGGNRQLWIADSASLAINGTNSVLRISLGGTSTPDISSSSTSALVQKNLTLQVNGGNVSIGTTDASLGKFTIQPTTGEYALVLKNAGNDAAMSFNVNAADRTRMWVANATGNFNVYTVNNDTVFWNGNGLSQVKTMTLFTDTSVGFESNVGIGVSPNSNTRCIIKGIDAVSTHYALQLQNSAASSLLYIRNDGLISAPLMVTSNAGLSTGDTYVDTAANILANGDKVVGWKV